jgi:heterodisulfide reductase subunit A
VTSLEELKIGVYVCHCGVNIGGVVNVPEVVEYAKTLPNVAWAEGNLYTCSEAGLSSIKESIKKNGLNRVVVASCTPRTHEPLFRSTCEEAGLNKYLFEMANIREQCSWVHSHQPEEATVKAKDIVRMAVARARWLEPQDEPEVDVCDSAMVIGGGVAGLTSALSLANQGFKVHLIEKDAQLGGLARRLGKIYPTLQDSSEIIDPLIKKVTSNKNIQIYTSANLKDVSGYVGNFKATLKKEPEDVKLDVGTIVIASGALNYEPPKGSFQYGVLDRVVTQLQLEAMLTHGKLAEPERVLMIQCVGSRTGEVWTYELSDMSQSFAARLLSKILGAKKEEGWPYCSKICCMNAIKNAIRIKEQWPKAHVDILFSDLRAYKEYEDFYRKARALEVKFIRYIREIPPEITEAPDKKLKVTAYDTLAGVETEFLCDLVALSTPLCPSKEDVMLARMLKVPLGPDGFFMEAHPKLRPVDCQSDGIFIAGTACGPRDIPESIISAMAVAARASILMANKKLKAEALTADVNTDLCIGCGLCEELCPYGAHKIENGKSKTIPALCRGCGVCAADCPRRAITMRHYTDQQILAQVEAMLTP